MQVNFTNLSEAYEVLKKSNSKSLLKQNLTDDVMEECKDKKTEFGSTLLDVIRSGVANLDSGTGLYAPDYQSYEVFAPLFDKVIRQYHTVPADQEMKHPAYNFGNLDEFQNIDPTGEFVISTRCRLARNLCKIPFNPVMTEAHYEELEKLVKCGTDSFQSTDLEGEYLPLTGMSPDKQNELIESHFLFKEGDRFLEAANALRFWPKGRGIFMNKTSNFLIWVGEEDHLRLISMEKGADLGAVVKRLKNACDAFSKHFDFAQSDKLGFMTFCPTNLGTSIRSSVHIKLPKLSKNMENFEKIASKHNLQIRGVHGEHSESKDGIYDVSNKRRYGATEHDVISDMYYGIKALIEEEKKL